MQYKRYLRNTRLKTVSILKNYFNSRICKSNKLGKVCITMFVPSKLVKTVNTLKSRYTKYLENLCIANGTSNVFIIAFSSGKQLKQKNFHLSTNAYDFFVFLSLVHLPRYILLLRRQIHCYSIYASSFIMYFDFNCLTELHFFHI